MLRVGALDLHDLHGRLVIIRRQVSIFGLEFRREVHSASIGFVSFSVLMHAGEEAARPPRGLGTRSSWSL